jgi:hypothetical protein
LPQFGAARRLYTELLAERRSRIPVQSRIADFQVTLNVSGQGSKPDRVFAYID